MFEFRANERQKKGERWQMVNEKVRAERKRAEGRGRGVFEIYIQYRAKERMAT